jgi:NADPH:quinone reductase-like Zn-dependent oxidoreductase
MKAYQLRPGGGISNLRVAEIPTPVPAPHEVLIKTHAASLNYRDLMFARGDYVHLKDAPLVPLGDGAGEVVAVGARVTRFKPGDRVTHSYFPGWIDGASDPVKISHSFGTNINGVLAESFVTHEDAAVRIPSYLSYAEAATLSCAGTTAWNALFIDGGLKPGATVLLQGTGGVSIFALQLAKAAGLRTIITSSSDEKLERARALGADATINYRKQPEWQDEARRLTEGRGVDLTVEVGGAGTLSRSLIATRMGGTVSVIGGLAGLGGTPIEPVALLRNYLRLSGFMVGSRVMLEDLVRFMETTRFHPVIDREFSFDEAPLAYEHLKAGRHFGKVVIRVAS